MIQQPPSPMKNLFLSGFMGVGKSTVGARLALSLGSDWGFIDLDELIESTSGKKISAIFQDHGEAYFRDLETQCLKAIDQRNQVVALGGGSVLRQENRSWIHSTGIQIYLKADLPTLLKRLETSSQCRPLLMNQGPIHELIQEREEFYGQAHWSIETTGCTVDEVVKKILARVMPVSTP